MCKWTSLFAMAVCVTLSGSASARAQSAILYGRTLYVLGSSSDDVLVVSPNQDANGYVVLTGRNRTVEPVQDAGTTFFFNAVPSTEVDEIYIRAYGGNDTIELVTNDHGETVFNVNQYLRMTINAGNGSDTIDPGVTIGGDIVIYGGLRDADRLFRYFIEIFGRRYFVSPTLADLTNRDIITLRRR